MFQVAEIERRSLHERLQTVALLGNSLGRTQDWHGSVLEDRLEKNERGQGDVVTVSHVNARLQRATR